jgi:hypothetical protein
MDSRVRYLPKGRFPTKSVCRSRETTLFGPSPAGAEDSTAAAPSATTGASPLTAAGASAAGSCKINQSGKEKDKCSCERHDSLYDLSKEARLATSRLYCSIVPYRTATILTEVLTSLMKRQTTKSLPLAAIG